IKSVRMIRSIALAIESSGRCLRTSAPRVLDGEPCDRQSTIDSGLAEGLTEVGLSGTRRTADRKILPAVHPLQRPQRLLGRPWDGAGVLVPGVERLPGWERRPLAAAAQSRGVTAGGLLREEDPHDLSRVP